MPQPDPPWVTGYLTRLLIRYLEERHPTESDGVPYGDLFVGTELAERAKDARALLTDPNQWLPQEVLTRLVRVVEDITGEAEVAYLAGRSHFAHPRSGPSIFEIIATLLDDVRRVVLASDRWATAFTTYVNLQTIEHADRPDVTVLSRLQPGAQPTRTPGLFLRGQFEGFPALFGSQTPSHFQEEYSQLSLAHLLVDFEDYELDVHPRHVVIRDRRHGAAVATAEGVRLSIESIPSPDGRTAPAAIADPDATGYRVYTASGATVVPIADAQALRIVDKGVLRRGRVGIKLVPGAIYGAPYSRYRYHWTDQPKTSSPAEQRLREISLLLFTHLHELKQTQQRLLHCERDNLTLRAENAHLKLELAAGHRFADLITQSPLMSRLCEQLERVVETDSTVLLLGETGTGKEVLARSLHYNGPRKDRPFVAVNCGALHEGLLESELFGHERGAFTGAMQRRPGKFESAHGGTLFLDEVGELSAPLQVKLLRVLQERTICRVGGNDEIPVNVRVIAATHRCLPEMVRAGTFRQDLYYRLNVVPLTIPPLRQRVADIPTLAATLLAKLCERLRRPIPQMSDDAMRVLLTHPWPGNVREMENVLERALILAGPAMTLTASHLPAEWFVVEGAAGIPPVSDPWNVIGSLDWSTFTRFFEGGGSFDDLLGRIEWAITKRAVEEHQGNKSHAARTLRRSYRWLRKLEKEHLGPSSPPDA